MTTDTKCEWIEGPPPEPGIYWAIIDGLDPTIVSIGRPTAWTNIAHHIKIEKPKPPRPPKPSPGWYVVKHDGDTLLREVVDHEDRLRYPSGPFAREYWRYEFGPRLPDGWEP